MEVGPTCHYVMGGVKVDPDTAAAYQVPGLFAAGEVAGGMHGSNRLGGNSLSDLLVFGRRAGAGAAEYVEKLASNRPTVSDNEIARAHNHLNEPFTREGSENPYALHDELQNVTQDLVGIIRNEKELIDALVKLESIRQRATQVKATGGRAFNPGFHLALDLENMLLVSESIARSALARQESRGGHTRDDYPKMDPNWRTINHLSKWDGKQIEIDPAKSSMLPIELIEVFEMDELKKYYTEGELAKGGK
jgi:succinate dehydrogenase / fumarate reductase flavoprotein subunit